MTAQITAIVKCTFIFVIGWNSFTAAQKVARIDITNGAPLTMRSPSFPWNYPNNYNYVLFITATPGAKAIFTSSAFSLEYVGDCRYDYFSVNGQRFCGTNGPKNNIVNVDSSSQIIVRFVTDGSVTSSGFSVTFWQEVPALTSTTTPSPTPVCTSNCDGSPQCGIPQVPPRLTGRIVGGTPALAHSWPWQIFFNVVGTSFCGGSLISSNWVLTAAHCCKNKNAASINIYLGAQDISQPEPDRIMRQVKRLVIHPNYDYDSNANDFCLAELVLPVERSAGIIPVCLPSESDPPVGTKCYVTGWGEMQANRARMQQVPTRLGQQDDATNEISIRSKRSASNVLMQTDVAIVDQSACNAAYSGGIDSTMICAASPGKDTCQGDSGGPLVCQRTGTQTFVLYGVASFGRGCGQPDFPGVYGRVSQATSWIRSVVGNFA
ncbi:serine protease 1-like [Paramacrobiotus metropolitanus]|uniref:serine protease 1-like n=1 Tax=Paramacrobiotus metropolitanus TaxID=2943436 RepID=UPI002445FED7|nr:serine protease 1-like [Paramacrobiotus metropolitanus]